MCFKGMRIFTVLAAAAVWGGSSIASADALCPDFNQGLPEMLADNVSCTPVEPTPRPAATPNGRKYCSTEKKMCKGLYKVEKAAYKRKTKAVAKLEKEIRNQDRFRTAADTKVTNIVSRIRDMAINSIEYVRACQRGMDSQQEVDFQQLMSIVDGNTIFWCTDWHSQLESGFDTIWENIRQSVINALFSYLDYTVDCAIDIGSMNIGSIIGRITGCLFPTPSLSCVFQGIMGGALTSDLLGGGSSCTWPGLDHPTDLAQQVFACSHGGGNSPSVAQPGNCPDSCETPIERCFADKQRQDALMKRQRENSCKMAKKVVIKVARMNNQIQRVKTQFANKMRKSITKYNRAMDEKHRAQCDQAQARLNKLRGCVPYVSQCSGYMEQDLP